MTSKTNIVVGVTTTLAIVIALSSLAHADSEDLGDTPTPQATLLPTNSDFAVFWHMPAFNSSCDELVNHAPTLIKYDSRDDPILEIPMTHLDPFTRGTLVIVDMNLHNATFTGIGYLGFTKPVCGIIGTPITMTGKCDGSNLDLIGHDFNATEFKDATSIAAYCRTL